MQEVRTAFHALADEGAEPATTAEEIAASQAADVKARAQLNFNKLGCSSMRFLSHAQLCALLATLSAPRVMPADAAVSMLHGMATGAALDVEAVRAKLRKYAQSAPEDRNQAGASATATHDGTAVDDTMERIMAAVRALQPSDAGASGSSSVKASAGEQPSVATAAVAADADLPSERPTVAKSAP